jgi:hypothetical protein
MKKNQIHPLADGIGKPKAKATSGAAGNASSPCLSASMFLLSRTA